MATTYLDWLRGTKDKVKPRIDELLRMYKVESVGGGYIDLITVMERANQLVDKLTAESVVIQCITWWCHCTEESQAKLGCPHGMGGPWSKYYEGWFSEMQIPTFESFD